MRKRAFITLVVAGLVGVSAMRTLSQPNIPELKNVMKAKLAHTQSVLEGLALEDFDRIKKGGQNLAALSRADAWNVHRTPEYIKFSKDFQDVADALVVHANAKKLEACTLDYVQLTMLCVKCHSHTRKAGVALNDPQMPEAFAARFGH
ncbi:MAG: hypothetical protein WD768_09095 [Phycisphaeraceae bacterium]